MNKYDEIIAEEFNLYFKNRYQYIKEKILNTSNYSIWKYLYYLRNEEKYSSNNKFYSTLMKLYYKIKKHRLGNKIGFDIPPGVFDAGLKIWHIGPLIVNPNAKVGKNCVIVGNTCIGNVNGQKSAAKIGNNCMIGWGGVIIGDINLGNNCKIGACALVNKDFNDNSIIVGVPGKNIRK